MQRMITAVTVGAVLLAVSACTGSGDPGPAAQTGAPATSSAPAASAAPRSIVETTARSSRYTKNTKQVCSATDKIFEGKEIGRFADDLGRMIGYKEAERTAEVNRSKAAAAKQLRALAARMRKQTSTADDADVRAAGQEAADSIEKSADDPAFYAKLKSVKTLEKTLRSEMTPWITPVASVCT
jgi:hypothetical protein